MTYVLVAYDISDDEARNKLARDLQAAGFTRIQRSVYVHKTAYRGVVERVKRLALRRMDPRTDSVLIMIIPSNVYERNTIILGGRWDEQGDILL